MLWSGGRQWIGNASYWPYYVKERTEALSWRGSNAPHLVGEPADSVRETQALRHIDSIEFSFVELQRTRPDGFAIHRQILRISSNLWLVIDALAHARDREVNTVWTAHPELHAKETGSPGMSKLASAADMTSMELASAGSTGHKVMEFRGRRSPFAGWATAAEQSFCRRQPLSSRSHPARDGR